MWVSPPPRKSARDGALTPSAAFLMTREPCWVGYFRRGPMTPRRARRVPWQWLALPGTRCRRTVHPADRDVPPDSLTGGPLALSAIPGRQRNPRHLVIRSAVVARRPPPRQRPPTPCQDSLAGLPFFVAGQDTGATLPGKPDT